MKGIGNKFEDEVKSLLKKAKLVPGTHYQHEVDIISVNGTAPDFLFVDGVRVVHGNNKEIKWLECKSGLVLPGYSPYLEVLQYLRQMCKHAHSYGPGCVVWKQPVVAKTIYQEFVQKHLKSTQNKLLCARYQLVRHLCLRLGLLTADDLPAADEAREDMTVQDLEAEQSKQTSLPAQEQENAYIKRVEYLQQKLSQYIHFKEMLETHVEFMFMPAPKQKKGKKNKKAIQGPPVRESPPSLSVYTHNFPMALDEKQVHRFFQGCGEIDSIYIHPPGPGRKKTASAHINFKSLEASHRVLGLVICFKFLSRDKLHEKSFSVCSRQSNSTKRNTKEDRSVSVSPSLSVQDWPSRKVRRLNWKQDQPSRKVRRLNWKAFLRSHFLLILLQVPCWELIIIILTIFMRHARLLNPSHALEHTLPILQGKQITQFIQFTI
jgi:hypothetical protein